MSLADTSITTADARATRGRVPITRCALNGVPFPILISEALFVFAKGQHELVTIICTSTEIDDTEGLLDSTISFYWGQAPRTELFCGYIVSVAESGLGEGVLSFSMTILGVTRLMQEAREPRFFANHTIPNALSKLAAVGMMGFATHPHPYVWRTLAQTSESDWRMTSDLAGRLGWEIYTRYGVVMCYDPLRLFRDNGVYARLYSSPKEQDFEINEDRRLLEFTPTAESEDSPDNMGVKVAYFTDADDLQVASQTGTFSRYRWVPNFVIRNAEEAKIYTDAPLSNPDAWQQEAQARIWGDADIYPGMNVDVVTSNTRLYQNKYNGRWLVRGVQHKMDRTSFQTLLYLKRPAVDAPVRLGPYVPFWQQSQRAKPVLWLHEGRWISSWNSSLGVPA